MAGRLDLAIDKGSTFEKEITWSTVTNNVSTPVNLTGMSIRAMFREEMDSPSPFLTLTTENGGAVISDALLGKFKLLVPAATSSAIIPISGVWDVELVSGVTVVRLLEGKVKLKPEVTR